MYRTDDEPESLTSACLPSIDMIIRKIEKREAREFRFCFSLQYALPCQKDSKQQLTHSQYYHFRTHTKPALRARKKTGAWLSDTNTPAAILIYKTHLPSMRVETSIRYERWSGRNERGYLVQMSHQYRRSVRTSRVEEGASVPNRASATSNDPRLAYSDGTHLEWMAYVYRIRD